MNKRTAHTDTTSQPLVHKVCAVALIVSTIGSPALSSAALFPGLIGRTALPFVPAAGQLPQGFNAPYGGATKTENGSSMTVTQNEGKDKVIIDWSSFNIGSNASVRFYQGIGTPGTANWQPKSNYATLNRIYDLNPSVINGSLTADGRVYLINRNGVFFGPNAKVQVQSLVASTFTMSDDDFKNGLLRLGDPADPDQPGNGSTISNEGSITANYGGSVFLVGPKVQNLGTISAPGGKIDLVGLKANGQVRIQEITQSRNDQEITFTDPARAGDVANMPGGSLQGADGGWIALYGNTVRNDGMIRAVTTRTKNGVVILSARELAATGAGSSTDVEVSDSAEALGRTAQNFTPGTVTFTGLPGYSPLARVDHQGSITAHSGNVSMEATERVFLGEKSSIDVSGLDINRPMSDQFIEVQLNSLYLRDDYGQKNNTLILGSKVWVDVLSSSSIGNLSSYYLGMQKNARDLSTVGGTITIGASPYLVNPATSRNYTLSDIIISRGAGFTLSGGKVTYSGPSPTSTKMIGADGRIYDISSAPQWMTYKGILGNTIKSYGKFGSETLKGISFGGHLLPMQSNPADRVVGGSAGSLTLSAGTITGLDDFFNLKALVTTGLNQTVSTPYLDVVKGLTTVVSPDSSKADNSLEKERYLNYLISLNRGLEAPIGGKMVIGNSLTETVNQAHQYQDDAALGSVVVRKSVTPAAPATTWDSAVLNSDTPTLISADMLTRAKLSGLGIHANTTITTESDAVIVLRAGGSGWEASDASGNILRTAGSYLALARRIEFLGSVTAPGGGVTLHTRPNISSYGTESDNPLFRPLAETIFLGDSSRISTAGERIDNSLFRLSPLDMRKGGFIAGGTISLTQDSLSGTAGYLLSQNNENSIVVKDGALLDVSGGYLINEKGVISGGNAGILTVRAPTISLGGDLRGFSLPGKDGGEVVLHAQNVVVAAQGKQFGSGFSILDSIPDGQTAGELVLAGDRFRNTGFSRITLKSTNDLLVSEDVQLAPSLLKSDITDRNTSAEKTCSAGTCLSTQYPTYLDQIGKSSVSLIAGTNVSRTVDPGTDAPKPSNTMAHLTIAHGAAVTAEAGGTVTLSAPQIDIAGTLSTPGGTVSASATQSLVVRDGGSVSAVGYNKTGIITKAGQTAPLPLPMAGGKVTLEASAGELVLEAGSRVDVSGSERIEGEVRNSQGTLSSVAVAGDAGSLTLTYGTGMMLAGTIAGGGKMAGARNGNLTIKNNQNKLTLSASDVDRYQGSGFDALTFSSPVGITIPENLALSVGRSLTLDSPLIQGTGAMGASATIRAPWIRLFNTGRFAADAPGSMTDSSSVSISFLGNYLDVKGSLLVKGFGQVNLQADHDLTFADFFNSDPNVNRWLGSLATTASGLTLQADRVYPTTASAYTITTPGKTTILPGVFHDSSPIWSAGGSLTIEAAGGIDHRGFLAAPQGNITLDGKTAGRVELAEGSVITTAGAAPVTYGYYDSSTWWDKYVNGGNTGTEVTAAPAKSITLKGNEVIVRNGAAQDLSGGGSIYASNWQPGIPGSKNPLTISGRYVILPDGTATRPGDSIYLEAMPELGLKAGIYSLLPIEYAFVPGALVIQDTGKQLLAGQKTISKEKYPVTGGYMTVRDTAVASQVLRGFSVRRSEEVLKEGDFSAFKSLSNGDGGSFAFNASGGAAWFDGTVNVNPLAGYRQGNVSFVAGKVEVVNSLAAGAAPSNTLQLDGNKLSNLNIGRLHIGDTTTTSDVTVQSGVILNAASVTLSAKDAVTLAAQNSATGMGGAQVNATNGEASIITPNGTFTLGDGAQLTAQNGGVKLDVNNTVLNGTINAGVNGTFSVTANGIKFDDASALDGYFHMTSALEKLFSQYRSFTIASRGDMVFLRDVDLNTGSLTVDAARYLGTTAASFTAKDMLLLNSGATRSVSLDKSAGSSLSLTADNITIAPRLDGSRGNIAFDQFETVNISSANDLVVKGAGTITARGDLNLSAARITTAQDRYKADGSATVANITVDGRYGAVTLKGNSGTAGTGSMPGGSLQILGNSITQTGGMIDVAAGQIGLTATNDIAINGTIQAKGSEQTAASGEKVYYSGGRITLQSDSGMVDLQSGSALDVSAAAEGDAGTVILSAKNGGVIRNAAARITGSAGVGGTGGSFDIDSATLTGVGGLNGLSSTLAGGGFTERLSIRSRAGDLALTNGNTLTGREVVVAADGGSITVNGAINADASDGSGRIELYAGTTLELQSGSSLSAQGTSPGSRGGEVLLSSLDGSDNAKTFNGSYALNVESGSAINVSGNGGTGGTVHMRAYQGRKNAASTGLDDVNIGAIGGSVSGAGRVEVEAVKAERINVDITVTQASLTGQNGFVNTAKSFSSTNDASIKTRLGAAVTNLQGGVEIATNPGKNLIIGLAGLTAAIDLNTTAEPVVLTLKSGKDLTINQSITDARTGIDSLYSNTMQHTAAINLVAGSDGGANYMSVARGSALTASTGDLTIANGKKVYTENAPIRFAAGNDAIFKGTATGPNTMINSDMKYNLGSYGGSVRGDVGRDLSLTAAGSVIQTALGTIDIRTGRDLKLGNIANSGAIRTTGEYDNSAMVAKQPLSTAMVTANRKSYWTYHNGGSIDLNVGNMVDGNLITTTVQSTSNGWDGAYVDSSLYNATTGAPTVSNGTWFYLAAGFGGVRESGQSASIPVTVGIATMGGGDISVRSGGSLKTQIGAFGRGNRDTLSISSGNDMVGRFRVMNGSAALTSGGSFGTAATPVVAELADARMRVAAMGDVRLGAVQNPDNTRNRIFAGSSGPSSKKPWNLTYSQKTGFSAASLAGNATLYGTNPYEGYASSERYLFVRRLILPPSFALSAFGDIDITQKEKFILAPSVSGNLVLSAGGSIKGSSDINATSGFIMQDVDIATMYGRQEESLNGLKHSDLMTNGYLHSGINHLADTVPARVSAGADINNLNLYLNKPAEVSAGGDITRLIFVGQNTTPESLTSIRAGGDIDQGLTVYGAKPVIELGGPGTLLVQAGGNINLGNSGGINSVGNTYNSAFSGAGTDTDSDIIVTAGANSDAAMGKAAVQAFFTTIKTASDAISTFKTDGNTAEADRVLAETGPTIRKFFYRYDDSKAGTGNLDLVDSAISSRSGSIYAMAGSKINVGKTALSNAPLTTSGITTLYGGELSVYAGGDINVNESRLMSYLGGDITVWSDQGNINAGRGSKTVVSAPTPVYIFDSNNVLLSVTYTPPSAGSGIRALTFDIDGSGPIAAPEQGKVHIYTPKTLDAGEAGIQGGKLMIAASTVLNSQNITAGAGSVGVPASNQNSISIGPMTGAGDMSNDKKMIETISGGGGEASKKTALAKAEDFLMKYLDVKVVDLADGTL